jgi:hypothetical protein
MRAISRRVQLLEEQSNLKSDEEGARALVMFCLQFGMLAPDVDIESAVQQCVREGRTMAKLLAEVDGKTRGLPGPHEMPPEEDDEPIVCGG